MSVFHGVIEQTCCDESCRVSHVNHEDGTHLVGDFSHALVVPLTAVCRTTSDDELWLVLESELLHLVVVHATCFLVQVVAYRIVEYSRCIYCRTM